MTHPVMTAVSDDGRRGQLVATKTSPAAADAAASQDGGTGIDPMHQFEIVRFKEFNLFGLDVSFTNSSLFMFIAIVLVSTLMLYGSRKKAMVPGRLQSITELSYEFVANMVRDNAGSDGLKYFPFIFSHFLGHILEPLLTRLLLNQR